MTTPDPEVRELAARAHWAASNGRRLRDGEAPTLGSVHYAHADAILAAVEPVIRRQERAATVQVIAKNLDQIADSYNPVFTPPEYTQEVAVKSIRRAAFERAAEVARSHAQPTEEKNRG